MSSLKLLDSVFVGGYDLRVVHPQRRRADGDPRHPRGEGQEHQDHLQDREPSGHGQPRRDHCGMYPPTAVNKNILGQILLREIS